MIAIAELAPVTTGKVIAAYIRESSGDSLNASEKEGQLIDCRRLAERDGHDPSTLVVYDDWGRSGSRGSMRPAQQRLMADMAEGQITVIYARSNDRLMRDVRGSLDFEDLARAHAVRIVTEREGDVTAQDPDANFMTRAIPLLVAEQESRLGKVRAVKAQATRLRNIAAHVAECDDWRQCGDAWRHGRGQEPFGTREGEDVAPILEAFREVGSYHGAARLLIARGVVSRMGSRPTDNGIPLTWSASTIRGIVLREAPELVPIKPTRGSRTISIHLFTRLLVCPHDGSYLTSQFESRGTTGYLCRVGHRAPPGTHPRPYSLRESIVLEWAKRETRNIINRQVTATREDGTEADLNALRSKRQRLGAAFVDGIFAEEEYRRRLAEIDADLERLEGAQRSSVVWQLGVNWRDPVGQVNARLRDLLHSIRLGYLETPGPVHGRHSGVQQSLVPIGGVWRRCPVVYEEHEGEEVVLDDTDAEPVTGGWYLPSVTMS